MQNKTHPVSPIHFSAVGRLPDPNDNVAIATRILPAGTVIELDGTLITTDYTILLGHRFAIRPIATGEGLLSWGLPFGIATRPIQPGQYVANDGMIEALHSRTFDAELNYTFPTEANFRDRIVPYEIDEATFQPGEPLQPYPNERTFMGYQRAESRGVGTRNMVVILGTTSSTAAFARALAEKLQPEAASYANIDGIVPIAHTEGSGYRAINNRDFLLRALAGLMVHPNVGAVLAVDLPSDAINNQVLRQYMADNNYPLDDVLHGFHSLSATFSEDMDQCACFVQGWLPTVNEFLRSPQSVRHLSIALQCGGSDAFSGISGNPLASSVVKEVIRYGGRANLAETDELIGSEAYVLQNVRSLDLARKFLDYIAQFKERLSWHGQSAEGNPSGGNKYRGLYNIALKSIGAAAKRHPDVRLEHVVDYGERMLDPGYYFMNTPGNDLESIAGQVSGGSNLIIFVTGNGSITNFPFVPTIKVMTTTQRYQLLENEMDVNAGAYLDGTSMDDLTAETLDLLIDIASGQPSKGELAGHSQISIWRNWQQTDRSRLPLILERERPDGQPIPFGDRSGSNGQHLRMATPRYVDIPAERASPDATLPTHNVNRGKIGLIIPTSLCSGQIARLATQKLNATDFGPDHPLERFATLVHTEGCGVAFASTREIYAATMVGHATHPLVGACLFLEHGCEKAHNDYLHSLIVERGLAEEDFGWASVQLDGGIEKVIDKIGQYFQAENVLSSDTAHREESSAGQSKHPGTHIAIMTEGELPDDIARSFASVARAVVSGRGSVVIPNGTPLAQSASFWEALGITETPQPTLAYGQSMVHSGLHLMETPTQHWTETVTGLGATGAELIVGWTDEPRAGHPFVPILKVGTAESSAIADLVMEGDAEQWGGQLNAMIERVFSEKQALQLNETSNIDFQLTRGWLGIST